MMSGPDPYTADDGSGDYYNPWNDTINNLIWAGADVAKTAETGTYPPGSTVINAPTIGYPPAQQRPAASMPTGAIVPTVQAQPQPGAGIQLSTTTLMLIVGGFLLFTLGKRGR